MKREKQTSFFPKPKREHGGSLTQGKRRAYRPLNSRLSHHITLKSQHATGPRSLFRHKKLILGIIHKAKKRFNIKVYTYALAGNHLHLLIKGQDRQSLQNFFRVVAGHSAQNILRDFPLSAKVAGGAPKGCKKNQRKFWQYLIYSRIVTWGREFKRVSLYIEKNILETLRVIAYEPRNLKQKTNSS